MSPPQKLAAGEEPTPELRQRRLREEASDESGRRPQEEGEPPMDVFGDNTTNVVVLAMALLGWLAQYAVESRCTC